MAVYLALAGVVLEPVVVAVETVETVVLLLALAMPVVTAVPVAEAAEVVPQAGSGPRARQLPVMLVCFIWAFKEV